VKRCVVCILSLALLFLVGCLPQEELISQDSFLGTTKSGETPLPPSTDFPFETIDRGFHSGIRDARQVVIYDLEAWRGLWTEHVKGRFPEPPLPPVNFIHEMVIAFFLGEKSTSGYTATVREIFVSDGKLVVKVDVETPPPGAFLLQVLTQPFHIVKVARTDLPVDFLIQESCSKSADR